MTAPDVRKEAFARLVRRATDAAKLNRNWSVPEVARQSGIGVNTLYRWLHGDWVTSPEATLVEKLCRTLDIPVDVAFGTLWPGGERPARQSVEPLPPEPDFEVLLRRLNDPGVPDSEKFLIRETIRGLAARTVPPAAGRKAG